MILASSKKRLELKFNSKRDKYLYNKIVFTNFYKPRIMLK